MNIEQALSYGHSVLVKSESPDLDSKILLCLVLDCQTTYLHTWPDKVLTTEQQALFEQFIHQRLRGAPVAHITGVRGFWSLDLKVTEATLIPRPDTELLVSLALTKIRPKMMVADLGTGSGAIALALATEQPDIMLIASDYSWSALQVAKLNALENKLNNVSFIRANWLAACRSSVFDVIISNPPYITEDDPHLLEGDVRFEPVTALASGKDGLTDIRIIVSQACQSLKSGGWLLVEHGYHQAEQVMQLYHDAGFSNISSHQDYGDNDRVVIGQLTL
ncbi:protein-(glutamine-N5) methyltransferase, release factor-specific [Methylophaga sp. 42_25_T18]|nr:protein-(glutamine-N5) methyltransferase, release factor-specific [Methylophaga sp. 42_25_T18]OUR88918.1 protein-(glutamine-N5) methyltransferase, release factor-specific [Methylophaga sp. 42_8_T64]